MKPINNKVQLIGRVCGLRFAEATNGIKVAAIRVQTHDTYHNEDGSKVNADLWHSCTAYGRLAEIAARYLAEGMEIAIEGLLCYKMTKAEGRIVCESYVELTELLMLTKTKLKGPENPQLN